MNLLYCGNEAVFDGVLTSALSIVKRLQKPRPIRLYLYTMSLTRVKSAYTPITQEQADFIQSVLQKHNADTQVFLCDVTAIYEEQLRENPNENCYCSPYTLLRLLADLTDAPDKILYLDADIMANKDISALYDIKITEYCYAAARDYYGKFLVNPRYINAGVLLLNLKKIRKTGLFERARRLLQTKKLPFADQSAIIRSTTKRKLLSQRYNDQKYLYKNTVVRHFSKRLFWLPYPHTDNIKQWQIDRVHQIFGYREFDDIYSEYTALKEKFTKEVINNGEAGDPSDFLCV